MLLSEITAGTALEGLEPGLVCTVVAASPLGDDAVDLVYKRPDGSPATRLITSADAAALAPASTACPWAFDGDAAAFQLACEAKRIDLAFLFDPMMAVHTSNVDPFPHQITAVYESMLPRQPLRFVLADDPGAGKTIMAGLYIRELVMRADAARVLVVAPGSLVNQWRDELQEKFGLDFHVFAGSAAEATSAANPFEVHSQLICRLDQLSRSEDLVDDNRQPGDLQQKLLATQWDLVIFDEAHKLSASYTGTKLSKTGRFRLAERLGARTRHLLLMTATPHNGKDADFQLFLSLLDSDRFYGKYRDSAHQVDTSDLMRRMVKEEMVTFSGTPLFPERRAYTVNYKLSDAEVDLYEAVTEYVKAEMGKADAQGGSRKGSVGLALTTLQRRLASSPEAIHQSLGRRRRRLADRLREEKIGVRGRQARAETTRGIRTDLADLDDDDLTAEEQEALEEQLVDQATAAETVEELAAEILILDDLEAQARALVESGSDRKWEELSTLLQGNPEMHDADGRQRKIIIFTEHRDTLNYLYDRIAGLLGNERAIQTISGSTSRDDRKKAQALFRSDPDVCVLIATDAAGEGVNLQCAHLMVNYDLPWNPNRLEQRFGRIHRIKQTEVCHLWSLVAKETREGAVYHRLLEKIETECEALDGKVFNILGEVFEEQSLKSLLIDAIRYNDRPETRAQLCQKVEHALDHAHLQSLLNRNALAEQTMSPERLFAVKEEMEKAEARRLQPHFVQAFFEEAFQRLGGRMHRREQGRFEITYVPAEIRERDRRITGRNPRESEPVLTRYARVCFDRAAKEPAGDSRLPTAVLLHPGHPLVLAVTDLVLEHHANLLRQGAIFVDPRDDGLEPGLLLLLTHEVKSGDGTVLSKRLQFIRVGPDGSARSAGWAPHLDLDPLGEADRGLVADLLTADWLSTDLERRALGLAAGSLVPEHFREVADRRIAQVDKTLHAVHERLTAEIAFWTDRQLKFKESAEAGKDMRVSLADVARRLKELEGRLAARKADLLAMRQVHNAAPTVLGGALVLPAGLLRERRGEAPAPFSADAAARRRIELLAMEAVMAAERARGCTVRDVSADNCGWDITSYPPPADDGSLPPTRHIEVKGRAAGNDTVTVSKNEVMWAFNQGEKYHLAVVLVGSDDAIDGPHYITQPFDRPPGWAERSETLGIHALLQGRPA